MLRVLVARCGGPGSKARGGSQDFGDDGCDQPGRGVRVEDRFVAGDAGGAGDGKDPALVFGARPAGKCPR
ncbi:hypothetical protein SLA_7186 [Streptomyces laurentii]|uniref:Uncharacterized protein n=1 Tax=Streptomyces laurentii TaxID=39478 RepID=A0A169PJ78_STRLU|nr:hypothetical protein SLA_7186 [Streptomyces laurentii]